MAVGNSRQLLLDLLARDKASPAINKVGGALDDLGDEAQGAARDLEALDRQIDATTASMQLLAQEAARTGDLDLTKGIAKYERELRKLNKVKLLLPEPEVPDLGKGIGSNLAGSPFIAAGLTAVAASAAPAMGATVAAGIVGGLGGGGILGGIALLKNDSRIKVAGQQLSENLLGGLRQSAEPLIAPLLDAMGEIEIRFARSLGGFDRIFAGAADGLDSFLGPALNGVENLIDAFGDLSPVIEPVMAAFGNLSETVLDAVAGGLRSLSDNGVEAAAAIDAIGKTLSLATDLFFGFINGMTEVYGWSLRVRSALGDDGATEALREYAREADSAGTSSDLLGGSYSELADEAENLQEAIEGAIEAERQQKDLNLSAAEANLAYRDTLKDVTEAIDKKKAVSRDEEAAVLDLARAINTQTQAMEDAEMPADEIARKAAEGEKEFRKQAAAAGYNSSEINKMVQEYLAVPAEVTSDAVLRGVNAAIADARRLAEYLDEIPDEDINVAIRVTGASRARAAANLAKQYAYAEGGLVLGPGTGTSDSIDARLSNGEYVMPAADVARPGVLETLERIRSGGGARSVASAASGGGWPGRAAQALGGDSLTIRIDSGDPLLRQILRGLSGIYRTEAGRNVNVLFGGSRG